MSDTNDNGGCLAMFAIVCAVMAVIGLSSRLSALEKRVKALEPPPPEKAPAEVKPSRNWN